MCVSSISTPNLSLIRSKTMEIYHLTGITGNTDLHTETESNTLTIAFIGSSNDKINSNKKHSENADTSTSVNFDLEW